MQEIGPNVTARAAVTCENRGGFARLRPGARPGVFLGTMEVTGSGECELDVAIDGARERGTARFVSAPEVRRASDDLRRFDGVVAAMGGTVAAGDVAPLLSRLRDRQPTERERRDTRPMRSPWWIIPFAGCICAEWALRRRAGLR
jgi:hypothetical protein